jgi:undecaprenyl-diphosphatase
MNFIQTVVLGIVEGITEFLPISSTAHMDFARVFMGIPITDFIKSFEIIIQLGAILAVLVVYFKKIFSSFLYIRNIIIAFIPTGIIGFLLYKIIKNFLIANTLLASIMLVLGGVIILIFENKRKSIKVYEKENILDLSVRELLILGLAQSLAVVPGVSRSGAVIVSGRSMNLSPKLITEFSFLLALPTMFAATFYDILKSGVSFSQDNWFSIFIGFSVSFFVALFVIKWLLNYVKNHSFKIFGWYRIVFGIIIISLFLLKIIN